MGPEIGKSADYRMEHDGNGLAERLRIGTAALHIEAERSGYVQEILKRRASRAGYAIFLRNLLPAYRALEEALAAHAGHAGVDLFDWRPLARAAAITADLEALREASGNGTLPLLPEGEAYAARIDRLRATAPLRLIGHAYVRYIGDLSGGQIVKSLLARDPGLSADMLTFYDFPAIADAEAYKDDFRARLDRAGEAAGGGEAIVEEAKAAFRHNIELSLAVQRAIQAAQRR